MHTQLRRDGRSPTSSGRRAEDSRDSWRSDENRDVSCYAVAMLLAVSASSRKAFAECFHGWGMDLRNLDNAHEKISLSLHFSIMVK